MRLMKQTSGVIGGVLVLTLLGCNQADKTVSKPAITENSEVSTGSTGVKIDPAVKTVVVVNPATGPATAQMRVAQIEAQQEKSQANLEKLMKGYSNSLDDPKAKEKNAEQMKKEMEAYQRETLELLKLRRQAAADTANNSK